MLLIVIIRHLSFPSHHYEYVCSKLCCHHYQVRPPIPIPACDCPNPRWWWDYGNSLKPGGDETIAIHCRYDGQGKWCRLTQALWWGATQCKRRARSAWATEMRRQRRWKSCWGTILRTQTYCNKRMSKHTTYRNGNKKFHFQPDKFQFDHNGPVPNC